MKIICSKSNLLYGVNIVSKAVPTRTTMAILECILIDASAGEIKLTANDMELGIETKIEGEIEERGIIALDAKVFSDIVRKLPDNEVVIETDSSFKTTITCEKAKFNIIGKSGEDFSYIPYIERNEEISISQFTLKEVIRQTIFSIADNDNNKLMTGELFEINENSLKVVSLDGHRISIRNIELKNNYEHKKVVVPGKTLQEISKILPGNADEDVSMYLSDNHIVFEFGNTTVVSRLIEGQFPDYRRVIPPKFALTSKVNIKELAGAVERVALFSTDGDYSIIKMSVAADEITITSSSPDVGTGLEVVSCQTVGDPLNVAFNAKYILDILKNLEAEEAVLSMNTSLSPVCVTCADEPDYTYIVTPVRVVF